MTFKKQSGFATLAIVLTLTALLGGSLLFDCYYKKKVLEQQQNIQDKKELEKKEREEIIEIVLNSYDD